MTDGCSDISAEDLIGCVSTRRDRSSSAVHQDRVRCIVNEKSGSKIPMRLKSGVCTILLSVKGERHAKHTNPKFEKLATLSGGNRRARL